MVEEETTAAATVAVGGGAFTLLSDDIMLNIMVKLDGNPRDWAWVACMLACFASLPLQGSLVIDLLPSASSSVGGGGGGAGGGGGRGVGGRRGGGGSDGRWFQRRGRARGGELGILGHGEGGDVEVAYLPKVGDHILVHKWPICLEEFKVGSTVMMLPCLHYYHTHCIAESLNWVTNGLCPICIEALEPPP